MAKINVKKTTAPLRGPIRSLSTFPDTATFEGANAYRRDAKSDLFLLGASLFSGEGSFYETAEVRDERFVTLVREVASQDPVWIGKFLEWLRSVGNIRTASIIGAIEAGRVISKMFANGQATTEVSARSVLASVLQRADEPGEAVAYWNAHYSDEKRPKWFRRALGDGAAKLYSEYSVLKYDTDAYSVRFADVLAVAEPVGEKDRPLYLWIMNRGKKANRHPEHGLFSNPRVGDFSEALPMAVFAERLNKMPKDEARALLLSGRESEVAKKGGLTWEQLSGFGAMDKAAWEAVIPNMGFMGLLRNLRNFDRAGISKASQDYVINYLTDPAKVAKSRQLPFRFLSAYLAAGDSDTWRAPLGEALDLATSNIPDELGGSTFIVLDTSASMLDPLSEKGSVSMHMAGAVFAAALAKKAKGAVRFVEFATTAKEIKLSPTASVLKLASDSVARSGHVGHGTDLAGALRLYQGESRVIIFSDFQTSSYVYTSKITAPTYGFNLAGYEPTIVPGGNSNWVELGGLSDSTFKIIPILEERKQGKWPWEA
jgi:hypothetical protein